MLAALFRVAGIHGAIVAVVAAQRTGDAVSVLAAINGADIAVFAGLRVVLVQATVGKLGVANIRGAGIAVVAGGGCSAGTSTSRTGGILRTGIAVITRPGFRKMRAAFERLTDIFGAEVFIVARRSKEATGAHRIRADVPFGTWVAVVTKSQIGNVCASLALDAKIVGAWIAVVARRLLRARQALSKITAVTGCARIAVLARAAVKQVFALAKQVATV
jgi:hypothetical protein